MVDDHGISSLKEEAYFGTDSDKPSVLRTCVFGNELP
jgi:hypothetical protein